LSLIAVVLTGATLLVQQRKGVEEIGARLSRLEGQNEERAEAAREFRASVEKRLDHIDNRVTDLERTRGQRVAG
jgi:hypothetical protein